METKELCEDTGNEANKLLKTNDITLLKTENYVRFARKLAQLEPERSKNSAFCAKRGQLFRDEREAAKCQKVGYKQPLPRTLRPPARLMGRARPCRSVTQRTEPQRGGLARQMARQGPCRRGKMMMRPTTRRGASEWNRPTSAVPPVSSRHPGPLKKTGTPGS